MTSPWQALLVFFLPMLIGFAYTAWNAYNGTGSFDTNVVAFASYATYLMLLFAFHFVAWFSLPVARRKEVYSGPLTKVAPLLLFHIMAITLVFMVFNISIDMAMLDKSSKYFLNLENDPNDVLRGLMFVIDLTAKGFSVALMDLFGVQLSNMQINTNNIPFYAYCTAYRLFFSVLSLRILLSLISLYRTKPAPAVALHT